MAVEVKTIWRVVVLLETNRYPVICLNGLRKTTENLSQDFWCIGRDSNRARPECKSSGALPLDRRVRFEGSTAGRQHQTSVTHILV
jgi:hypothetical protein